MPIYKYLCPKCAIEVERIQGIGEKTALCSECGRMMVKMMTFPAMVKMKGEGGYPSRRKFVRGSAPYTTRQVKPWGDYDPSKVD